LKNEEVQVQQIKEESKEEVKVSQVNPMASLAAL